MEIFKKMFAEKILSFHEGTNRSLEILTKMPLVGEYISNQVIHKKFKDAHDHWCHGSACENDCAVY